MNTPEWLRPGIYGALFGAAAIALTGFILGGWVTEGSANYRAKTLSRDDVVSAMVPVCLDMARTDPDRLEKLTAIREASTYQRRDALIDTGWATMPGVETPDRDIARACLASLDVDALPGRPETAEDEG